jgi:hypothetical protein
LTIIAIRIGARAGAVIEPHRDTDATPASENDAVPYDSGSATLKHIPDLENVVKSMDVSFFLTLCL